MRSEAQNQGGNQVESKQTAQNALTGLFLAIALLPCVSAYIAAVAGLWRFIGWCLWLW